MKASLLKCFGALSAFSLASAETIAEINGNRYLSPLNGTSVTDVEGFVTAVASNGIWMRSTKPDNDPATSESLFVFSSSIKSQVAVGDQIIIDGDVAEFRSDPTFLFLTELENPTKVRVVSSNNSVQPLVIGKNLLAKSPIGKKNMQPPTDVYTSLDDGNIWAVPNDVTTISGVNPILKPSKFGMDFWESLSGELVTVTDPVVLGVPNSFGDTWVRGNWTVTGENARGGLTISLTDGNPEAILIQTPLDSSSNPLDSKLGDQLASITGVITTAFGFYTIRPRTAVNVINSPSPATPPPTTLKQSKNCHGLTFSFYNVDNLTPSDANGPRLANQIVQFLHSPSILFLQEVQDNSGPTDDGTVSANQTLTNLADSIVTAGGPQYAFIEIAPLDDTTGGQPGGNIRNAYLYNPKVVKLSAGTAGNATQAVKVTSGPHLSLNPGLIEPNNAAFEDSRRPLAVEWEFVHGTPSKFFTVNVHGTSKGGSSSLFGDPRPPINLGVDQRNAQTTVVADFVTKILAKDPNARVIVAGDWNEFAFVEPQITFVQLSGLTDLDQVADTTPVERYSFGFDQNSQALMHVYISDSIKNANPRFQRIHVNTWADFADQVSDHDPDVVKLNACGA